MGPCNTKEKRPEEEEANIKDSNKPEKPTPKPKSKA